MKNKNNICLVGLMGSGKTTIGKILAKKLNCKFIDSDSLIEEKTGVKVPLIFEYEGEEGFRRRETKLLSEVVKMNNIVLATGGELFYQVLIVSFLARLVLWFILMQQLKNW